MFHQDTWREYFRCDTCKLVFVPAKYHLSAAEEKAEYDLHQNSPTDLGYRRFLNRIFEPVHCRLTPNSRGLDFGCGPGPTLSLMFEEAGHDMAIYDPFYAPNPKPLEHQYDFVTASEVVEHFCQPRKSLEQMVRCVELDGLLAIMTKLVLDQDAFADWHYKNDRTHVSFFSRDTFAWLAEAWKAELAIIGKDVVVFTNIGFVAKPLICGTI